MIGEDQAKGYEEEFKKEINEAILKEGDEKFQENEKKAMEVLGRRDEFNEKQKADSMAHDILILRTQINEMVKVLNKLQTGFVSKVEELKREMDKKLENHLLQIQAKIDKLNR